MSARAVRRSSGSGSSAVRSADLDGAVVPRGADEPSDRPAGGALDVAGDGESGEDDGQVGLDRGEFVVVDRPGR
jgi:hypothetical protein